MRYLLYIPMFPLVALGTMLVALTFLMLGGLSVSIDAAGWLLERFEPDARIRS